MITLLAAKQVMFALVIPLMMINGDAQDGVLGVYDDQAQCEQAALEQHVSGECYPVEGIIHTGDQPAVKA